MVFLVGSGELQLPFGWLQMFAAFVELLKKTTNKKGGKKRLKREIHSSICSAK